MKELLKDFVKDMKPYKAKIFSGEMTIKKAIEKTFQDRLAALEAAVSNPQIIKEAISQTIKRKVK